MCCYDENGKYITIIQCVAKVGEQHMFGEVTREYIGIVNGKPTFKLV